MTAYLVDTSVWSLALRRDSPPDLPEVTALTAALRGGEAVATTGLIVQEVLQGALRPATRDALLEQFAHLELVTPDLDDHRAAADLRNCCRSKGVQLGTVDALIAHLAVSRELLLLTTDHDFIHAARHCDLRVWSA